MRNNTLRWYSGSFFSQVFGSSGWQNFKQTGGINEKKKLWVLEYVQTWDNNYLHLLDVFEAMFKM